MKRLQVPGLLDIVRSDDAADIQTFAADRNLDRDYADRSIVSNGLLIRRLRSTLQIGGKPFPTIAPQDADGRASAQQALWTRLNAAAPHLATAPDELESLAAFVRGAASVDACGPLVQQVVGRLFSQTFQATPASWDAAVVLDKATRTLNPLLLTWWSVTNRVDRARQLLSGMVAGDLAGVHAIAIALHNIVNGLQQMRQIYADPSARATLSPQAAGDRCLVAPASVIRQPKTPTASAEGELTTASLVVLDLQAAHIKSPDSNVVFLRNTWSQCPAEQWVPALLQGVWRRACRLQPAADSRPDAARCPFS